MNETTTAKRSEEKTRITIFVSRAVCVEMCFQEEKTRKKEGFIMLLEEGNFS